MKGLISMSLILYNKTKPEIYGLQAYPRKCPNKYFPKALPKRFLDHTHLYVTIHVALIIYLFMFEEVELFLTNVLK